MQTLSENSSSAVLLNNQLRKFFKTIVGFRQGFLLSPILFNLFLGKIMQETLRDHYSSVSTGGRPIIYAAYGSPTTSILQATAMINFKTSPIDP